MSLQGKVALVTGGSRGIGRAIALKLAALGATVVINYNKNAEEAEAVLKAVREAGSDGMAVQADVSVSADAQRLIDETVKAYKRLDILVNNAGITRDKLLMQMNEEAWDAVID